MELAHVIYRVSTDDEYAERFRSDPESTLDRLGLRLNKDEQASLLSVLTGDTYKDILSLAERGNSGAGWG